jgi:hypothetical protein
MSAQVTVTKLHNVDQRKECFVQTATEFEGLPRLAFEANVPRKNGIQTILEVTVTGNDGVVILTYSDGPEFVKNDIVYQTISGGTITGGSVTISIKAKVSGSSANLQIGEELSLSSTYIGLDSIATVTDTLTSGSNKESVESWRERIAQEKRFPSTVQGSTSWFSKIAKQIEGITEAYPYSSDTIGEVDLYLSADAEVDGVPTTSQKQAVKDLFKLAPNDCLWSSLPDRINTFDSVKDEYAVDITDGIPAISTATKYLIVDEINKYFESRKPFISGFSARNTSVINRFDIFAIVQNVVASTPGETGIVTDVVITSFLYPAADQYIMPKGLRAKAGDITFI